MYSIRKIVFTYVYIPRPHGTPFYARSLPIWINLRLRELMFFDLDLISYSYGQMLRPWHRVPGHNLEIIPKLPAINRH